MRGFIISPTWLLAANYMGLVLPRGAEGYEGAHEPIQGNPGIPGYYFRYARRAGFEQACQLGLRSAYTGQAGAMRTNIVIDEDFPESDVGFEGFDPFFSNFLQIRVFSLRARVSGMDP